MLNRILGVLSAAMTVSLLWAPVDARAAEAGIASAYGSGDFGSWTVDQYGLPAYEYRGDPGQEPEPARNAPHGAQVGNDSITAFSFSQGYVQLYSQARLMQWVNAYDPRILQFGGGYGYLRIGSRVISTLYADHPADARVRRVFGVGYFRKSTRVNGLEITDVSYAPFGDGPVLLHDITIRNLSPKPLDATWFEYWGVNPAVPASKSSRGLQQALWNAKDEVLSIPQKPGPDVEWGAETKVLDADPYTVFAAPIHTVINGFESSAERFFGSGTRATPEEVAAGHLSGTLAAGGPQGSASKDMLGFSAPVRLAPGGTVTLRFAYGFAAGKAIARIVGEFQKEPAPLQQSERAWRASLPRISLDDRHQWVGREVTWAAYLVRSASVYEEACGYHTITQGGYYQYALGYNWGTRSWTHYILPVIYLDPELAREILRYTAHLQPAGDANLLPYGTASLCTRSKLPQIGTPTDSDAWFIFAAVSYALATRDFAFFNEKVRFFDLPKQTTVWEHLKLAFKHQQSLLGPHGGYLSTPDGGTDWSDGLSTAAHQSESLLVTAQVAYVYPLLAALANDMHDRAFASEVTKAAEYARRTIASQWIKRGWYARGYAGNKLIGGGIVFEEPQPWALLAGIPSRAQANELLRNIGRFLTGIGAPPDLDGPTKIGSAQIPARADPQVGEKCLSYDFSANGKTFGDAAAACWIGGNWFDLNGNLVWALSTLAGEVPGAAAYAWDEYLRNSLAVHASVFPDRWDGIVSVDDVCTTYYDLRNQGICGLTTLRDVWDGENAEQPTWMVMGLINLAGLQSTPSGYVVDPQLPMKYYSVRFPTAGVARTKEGLSGYLKAVSTGSALMRVRLEKGAGAVPIVRVDGRLIRGTVAGPWIEFVVKLNRGDTTSWSVEQQ